MLTKLIYVNAAVFISILAIGLPFLLMGKGIVAESFYMKWFAVPAALDQLLYKPWTLFTYMFLHTDFIHVLINMLWLYFLGQLFVQFLGERKLFTVYIAGGLAGSLLYILFYNLFPLYQDQIVFSRALGASASVMAIVVAVATYSPNIEIRLLFFGNVKLKYIALGVFILDIIGISGSNSGGHLAHIGGAILGFYFAKQWQKGKDITRWVSTASNFLIALFDFRKKSNMKVKYKRPPQNHYEANAKRSEEQAVIDAILDKISRSGYDSLSKKEKEQLFKAGKK